MFLPPSRLLTALLLSFPLTLAAPANTTASTPSNSSSSSTPTPSSVASTIDQLKPAIESLRQNYGVPGITIGYAVSPSFTQSEGGITGGEGNWTMGTATFGTADRHNNSVSAETLFGIGSNSKLFTALAVGLLVYNETKLLNGETLTWHTKMKDILPEWGLMDEYASDHVDLLDVMSMRTGLPRHDASSGWVPADQVVSNLRNLKPTTEIRHAWQYSNLHYIALSQIIPTLTNISFTDYVQTHIFDPLELESATFNATAAGETGRRSDGFAREGRNLTECAKVVLAGGVGLDERCLGRVESFGWWSGDRDSLALAGAGGVIMSATDMAKWVKELLQPTVLPPALIAGTVQTLSSIVGIAPSPLMGIQTYGLGQMVYTYRGYAIHGHDGSVPGQQSLLVRLPDQGFGFLVAVNDDDFGTAFCGTIGYALLDAVLGLEPIDWEAQIMSSAAYLPSYPSAPSTPREMPTDIAGAYTNPGYGTFNLVEYAPGNTSDILPYFPTDWTSTPTPLNLAGPIYLAQIDRVLVSFIALTHFDGPLFNWTAGWYADKLSAGDEVTGKVVTFAGTGTAVLAEGGMGLFGAVGQGPTVPFREVSETDLAEKADVWFVKR
ncbi:hypothetical protein IAT38_008131 [Cryptococcus sp. DSM 104549]